MVWKGGARSSRSYRLDQLRESQEPWEKARRKAKRKGTRRKHTRRK